MRGCGSGRPRSRSSKVHAYVALSKAETETGAVSENNEGSAGAPVGSQKALLLMGHEVIATTFRAFAPCRIPSRKGILLKGKFKSF
jgi:hypothetical protein